MKVFSQSPKGYLDVWKWGFVALFVTGLLRFFMAPIGIPIETGDKLVSLTVVLLVALVAYTAYFGWSGGKLGDVLATAFGLVIVYTAVLALFLSLSSGLGVPTYYTDPAHFRGELGNHLLAHLQAILFGGGIGTVLGGIAFGFAWLARWATKRRELSHGAAR